MAQYNRPPKSKAPKPDEFVSFFDHVVRYFLVHQKKFYVLIGAVLLGFGGYALQRYWVGKKMHDLALDYLKAEQAQGAEATGAWEALAKQDPPKPLRDVVALQLGGALAAQAQWEPSAQSFQKGAESKSFVLYSVARLAQGVALENAKKYSEALTVYQEIADLKDDPFRYRGKLGMARIYLAMGQPTEAENILLQMLVKTSDAPAPVKGAALSQLVAMKAKQAPETN
ncbi:tetratricopeptide repeat protein [Deltaproteobacteria bacterium PRO3]|nr:tetratricopeptide repeat protein [Deltaproteobacteria bacterium PRO3]